MLDESISLPHKLTLNERKSLTMNGVTEVVSFDEASVVLKTGMGQLSVHGEGLQLKNLTAQGGQIAVDGKITALVYEEPRQSSSWLQRLFR